MFNRLSSMSRTALTVAALALLAIPIGYVAASPGRLLKPAHIRTAIPTYPVAPVPNLVSVQCATGQVQLQTASLAGLVANTPVNVIAASAGKKIVVVGYNVSSNVAGSTVTFQDETAVTPLVFDGSTFAANDHREVSRGGYPIIITPSGAALDIAITGTSDVVKGSITYYYQ